MAVARHPVARIAPPAPAIISASRARVGERYGTRGDTVWLLPGDALARASEAIGDRATAIDTIIGRLRAAKLKATYETAEWENTGRKYTLDPNFVAPDHWKHYPHTSVSAQVWYSGDLRLYIGSVEGSLMETNVYLTYFRVRIERKGIEEIIANATPKPQKISPKVREWVRDMVHAGPPHRIVETGWLSRATP